MRTNIDIDDELLAKAMRDSGAKTKATPCYTATATSIRLRVFLDCGLFIRKAS